jgi:beta-lactamase class A
MLKRLIGGEKVYREFMKQSGGIVVDYDRNISCPKDMSLYLKMVYDFYKENEELGGELMEYLQNTAFNDRLNKLLPPNVKVAHKVGTQVRAVHDVGIIYAEKPYILSVMSKDVDEAEAPDVIANISEKVYKFVAGN